MTPTAARSPTRRRALVALIALAAVAVAGTALWNASRAPTPLATLVEPLAVGPFVREVTGTGFVEAVRERALSFPTGGTVAEVAVAEGSRVDAGETLARLDSAALERELTSVRSALTSAQADRERLAAQQGVDRLDLEAAVAQAVDQQARAATTLADAERALETVGRLFAAGAASRDEVRGAESALDTARRAGTQADLGVETARSRLANLDQLAAAQRASSAAQVAQLETQLANLEARRTDTTIVAPFAGVVTAVNVKSGDLVGTQPVLTLADTSLLRVRGRFDENRAVELAVGQPAVVVPDADATRRLAARIERISPVAVREGGSAQVTVDLAFDPEVALDAALARPGYTVTVRVRVRELDDALLMPLEAITESDGQSFVLRVERGEGDVGTASRVPVTVLERNPTVAAVEGDLRPGDLIAVINLDAIDDGDAVSFPSLGGGTDRGGD